MSLNTNAALRIIEYHFIQICKLRNLTILHKSHLVIRILKTYTPMKLFFFTDFKFIPLYKNYSFWRIGNKE